MEHLKLICESYQALHMVHCLYERTVNLGSPHSTHNTHIASAQSSHSHNTVYVQSQNRQPAYNLYITNTLC